MEDVLERVMLVLYTLILMTVIAIVISAATNEEPEVIIDTVCISLEEYTALTNKE